MLLGSHGCEDTLSYGGGLIVADGGMYDEIVSQVLRYVCLLLTGLPLSILLIQLLHSNTPSSLEQLTPLHSTSLYFTHHQATKIKD